jgi:uncharacterized protein (TIGR03437 family)
LILSADFSRVIKEEVTHMLAFTGLRSLFFALLAASTSVLAQGRVSDFLGVTSWLGTITISGNGSGSSSGGIYTDVWKYSVTSSISIQLPTVASNIEGWTGTFTGTSDINALDVSTAGGCSTTYLQTLQSPLGMGKTFTMHLVNTNQYVFYPSDYQAQSGTSSMSFSCAPGTLSGPTSMSWSPVLGGVVSEFQDLPATGFSLKGSETLTMSSPTQPTSVAFGGTPAVINVTVQWDFEPNNVSQLRPFFNDLGVVNNASFSDGSNPLAPGTMAAVFGGNLTDGSSALFSSFGLDGTLETTLAGAQATINGKPVPIFYATPAQLGIQIPTDLAGTSALIEVTVGGQTSAPQMVFIAPVAPGLSSTDQSGHGQGAILIANTDTLVAPIGGIPGRDSRPAKAGEFITIFCTGLGAVTPPLASGEPGTNNTTVGMPAVTIDGAPAMVQFSGIAPGFVGLNQVNVQVPAGTRTADDIPVVLTIAGKQSNTVTIAVSGS